MAWSNLALEICEEFCSFSGVQQDNINDVLSGRYHRLRERADERKTESRFRARLRGDPWATREQKDALNARQRAYRQRRADEEGRPCRPGFTRARAETQILTEGDYYSWREERRLRERLMERDARERRSLRRSGYSEERILILVPHREHLNPNRAQVLSVPSISTK